jgi:hypothetical protein
MVRFKVRAFCSDACWTYPVTAYQNRWFLIEFIPVSTSESGHDHTNTNTTSVVPKEAISGKDVFNALKQSVLLHFGDVGWGEVGASLAGEILSPSCLSHCETHSFLFLLFRCWHWRGTVKYFSPMTNLCIARVMRGPATSTTWAALVLLDRIREGHGGGLGRKVVSHVIHVSGVSRSPSALFLSLGYKRDCGCARGARHA